MQQSPEWADRSTVSDLFHLPRRQLNALVTAGCVRSLKMGQYRQCARLFSVKDIRAVLDDMARGLEPRRAPVSTRR